VHLWTSKLCGYINLCSSWKLKQSLIDQQEQDGVVTEPVKASSNTPMAAVTAFVTANLPVMMALAEADDYGKYHLLGETECFEYPGVSHQ